MTNEEFHQLMNLNKQFVKSNIQLPQNGKSTTFDLKAKNTTDKFYLDIDRKGRIELSKFKIQNRYALTKLPLVRIDIDSPPHINPNGVKLSRNHIHIYRETPNDTGNLPWAYNIEEIPLFRKAIIHLDFMTIFYIFCKYCNIETHNIKEVF